MFGSNPAQCAQIPKKFAAKAHKHPAAAGHCIPSDSTWAKPPGLNDPFSSRNEQLLSQLTKSTLDLGHASGEHYAGRLGSRKPSTDQASSSRLPQIIYPTKAGSKTSQVELGYCSWRIVDAMGTEAIQLGRREEDVFSCQTTDKCPKPRDPKPQSG